jgi:hypothetical protein
MEEREIENMAPEADSEDAVVTSVPPIHTAEGKPKKTRRVWRVVAVIVGVVLLVCIGAVLGGGLVYALMGGHSARHASVVVVPRPSVRGVPFIFPRSLRGWEKSDDVWSFDFEFPFEAIEHGGVFVLDVMDDTPASDAGLEVGNIITHIDGEAVEDAETLSDAIADHDPGDDVTLTVFQPGETKAIEIEVTLDEHPDDDDRAYLGVRLGGAFKIDVVCDGDECESFMFDTMPELEYEFQRSLGDEEGFRFSIAPGEAWPWFLHQWHLEYDEVK